jgi:hypothetical protein
MGRATYYRPLVNWGQRDAPVRDALTTLSTAKPPWGFWKHVARLRNTGHPWNHKRLWLSLKYEEVYLHAYETVRDETQRLTRYLHFYN